MEAAVTVAVRNRSHNHENRHHRRANPGRIEEGGEEAAKSPRPLGRPLQSRTSTTTSRSSQSPSRRLRSH
jgi:hypothetical protein